jgi:hypothetical protein
VEGGVAELGDVMLSMIVIVNAPTAVGSSALLGVRIVLLVILVRLLVMLWVLDKEKRQQE